MTQGVTITDDRRLYDAIQREVAKLRGAVVTVGIHGDDSRRDDGAQTNPQIGAIHEFGSGRIPERSFLRSTVDGSDKIVKTAEQAASDVAHGKLSAEKAANRVGVVAVGAVKRTIQSRIPPPLSQQTLERRAAKGAHGGGLASMGGAATPLIDSGQLIQSIQYRAEV
jgi:hypothetical protein